MQLFKESLKSLTNPIKGFVNVLIPREEPRNELSDFIFIYPRIFWMTFPSKEKMRDLADSLNSQFDKNNYFIWNLSEHTYNTKLFHNQVAEFTFPGYPCPPMQYLLMICKSILEWLSNDKNNVAFIHCQSNKGRSAVVIACLLTLLKVVNHPMEALTYFCNKLNLKDSAFLYPSQHLYVRNFANLLDNIKVNTKSYILERIIISEVPKFQEEHKNMYLSDQKNQEDETFKPYVQIFNGTTPVYNYLKDQNPMAYNRNDIAIMFEVGIEVTDDILIRCRHYRSEEERTSVFRIVFSPYFAFDEIVRIYSRDIDFSPEFEPSNNFYVDLVLKATGPNSEAQDLCQLKDDCLKLAREHRHRRDQQAKGPLRQRENQPAKSSTQESAINESPQKPLQKAEQRNAEGAIPAPTKIEKGSDSNDENVPVEVKKESEDKETDKKLENVDKTEENEGKEDNEQMNVPQETIEKVPQNEEDETKEDKKSDKEEAHESDNKEESDDEKSGLKGDNE